MTRRDSVLGIANRYSLYWSGFDLLYAKIFCLLYTDLGLPLGPISP